MTLRLSLGLALVLSGCAGGDETGVGRSPTPGETAEPASPEPATREPLTEADLEEVCVQPGEVPGALRLDPDVSGPNTLEEAFERANLTAPEDAVAAHVAGHYVVYGDRSGVATAPDKVTVVACSIHLFESPEAAASAQSVLVEGNRERVTAVGGTQERVEGLGEEGFTQGGVFQGTSSVAFIWRKGPAFVVVAVSGGEDAVTRDAVRRQVDLVDSRLP